MTKKFYETKKGQKILKTKAPNFPTKWKNFRKSKEISENFKEKWRNFFNWPKKITKQCPKIREKCHKIIRKK